MNRREFLKLVVVAAATYALPLDKAFTRVQAETGYLDGLIVSMAESEDGKQILIKTNRWISTRECFQIKHAWEHAFLGQPMPTPTEGGGYVWKAMDRRIEDRDVMITSLTDKKPKGTTMVKGNPDGFLSERYDPSWWVTIEEDGRKIRIPVRGAWLVKTIKPDPNWKPKWDEEHGWTGVDNERD